MMNPIAASPTRGRTQRAILDAAVKLWSRNPSATLHAIAQEADVARSTLYRYFPERSDLETALNRYAGERIAEATLMARPRDGFALEALLRLCQAYYALGDIIMLAHGIGVGGEEGEEVDDPSERAVIEILRRSENDGTIDPAYPGSWVQQLLWSTLYAAWTHARTGEATSHEALARCLRSLHGALVGKADGPPRPEFYGSQH